jgi:hypothetical protein
VSPPVSVSDEVLRHHFALHAEVCPVPGRKKLGTEQTCPHGTVIALMCACGDPLMLVESPTSTCHCRLVEVAP